ncbi:glycoside hydrolase family 5 protein [Acetobacter oeni]|uniref:Cellulase n=1 Tax=Acetobacter oeni TaxID=304077 RepID=A0A511XM14_9PROT|nr:glycoside hydrolase family 5 protein [Acetobacter oeni]MBB3884003.1 endoglucanase [Acetobacter oeni]GBR03784.1 cellulase [Acetobacter oeni LMG 21952]GEN63992.1 cellulase [Acetobacter oeni]
MPGNINPLAAIATLVLALPVMASPAGAAVLPGVNLAGPGFASGKLPGRFGWDYVFPRQQELDYYKAKGMKLYRLPLSWERLQPELSGELDQAYLGHVKDFVAAAKAAGGMTIIDIHNYGKYRGQLIGSDAVPPAAFIDLWSRLAHQFGSSPSVIFGLMNEPQQKSADEWAQLQQQAIDVIRKTGARNRISVSGIGWDGAHNFPQVNGDALARLHDPRNALIFEAHQYFDRDSSGTSPDCVPEDQVEGRLAPFTDWLEAHHAKGLLGEFGAGRSPQCLADLRRAMTYLYSRPANWFGWTYWSGGPIWGEYMYTLEPKKDGTERPQMGVLTDTMHAKP